MRLNTEELAGVAGNVVLVESVLYHVANIAISSARAVKKESFIRLFPCFRILPFPLG